MPLLVFLLTLIVLLGYIASRFEKWRVFDGLYWALITATTVGYGDIKPTKKLTKIIAIIIAMIGMILTGFIIAIALKTASIVIEKNTDPEVIKIIKARVNSS